MKAQNTKMHVTLALSLTVIAVYVLHQEHQDISRTPASLIAEKTVVKRTIKTKRKRVITYIQKQQPKQSAQSDNKIPKIDEQKFAEYQSSFDCEPGYTDYGEGCTKDEEDKKNTVEQPKNDTSLPQIDEQRFAEYQSSFDCEPGYTDYGEGCTKDEELAADQPVKQEQIEDNKASQQSNESIADNQEDSATVTDVAHEEAEVVVNNEQAQEQAERQDKLICVDEEEYNNMISEVNDLKQRLKTIASVIPESLWSDQHPNMQHNPYANNMMMFPPMDMSMMYMQWGMGFNPYTNMMMGQSFFPQMQTPASQVLQTQYPSFYNPITINNYYYGHQATPLGNQKSIPQNYFSGEMNFGGLDQVKFAPQPAPQSNRTPAYFSF